MKVYIVKKAKDRKIKEKIELIGKLKDDLYENKITEKILKKFKLSKDIIEGVVLRFDEDLEVTAKTVNGEVSLNESLMSKSFDTIMRYVIHEFVHVCQHIKNQKGKPKSSKRDETYLDNPEEVEAFKWQSLFTEEEEGRKKLDEYLEELMEYHDVPEKDQEEKIEELKDYVE
jgi:hypothetical protein